MTPYRKDLFILLVLLLYDIIRPSFKNNRQETGMLLEDLKQELDKVKARIESLRRHL